MRRSALAVALLLATAPLVDATENARDIQPELRVVEAPAPTIRPAALVAPALAEARTPDAATTARWVVLGILAGVVVFLWSLPWLMG